MLIGSIAMPLRPTKTDQYPPAKRRRSVFPEVQLNSDKSTTCRVPLLHKCIPLISDYVPLTLADGQRRYLTIDEPAIDDVTLDTNIRRPLLLDELSTLIDNAEQLVSQVKPFLD